MLLNPSAPTLSPDAAGAQRSHLPLWQRRWFCSLLITAAIILGILRFIGVFGGNRHTVWPGKVYRSAQLTGANLREALASDHIGTVLNLRGAETDNAWYQNEVGVCREMKVDHVDIAFSATHLPPPPELDKLVHTMDTARYPLLIHCMGGADRTGLASTIYLDLYQHVPLDKAENKALTFRYGHIAWGSAGRMDDFFSLYRKTSGGMDLRRWIYSKYPRLFSEEPHP